MKCHTDNMRNKVMEYSVTPYKYPEETRKELRHTTMSVTKQNKRSKVCQN